MAAAMGQPIGRPLGEAAAPLGLVGGPFVFSRMRIVAGGQILDDSAMYNRVHEMFNIFSGAENRNKDFW